MRSLVFLFVSWSCGALLAQGKSPEQGLLKALKTADSEAVLASYDTTSDFGFQWEEIKIEGPIVGAISARIAIAETVLSAEQLHKTCQFSESSGGNGIVDLGNGRGALKFGENRFLLRSGRVVYWLRLSSDKGPDAVKKAAAVVEELTKHMKPGSDEATH